MRIMKHKSEHCSFNATVHINKAAAPVQLDLITINSPEKIYIPCSHLWMLWYVTHLISKCPDLNRSENAVLSAAG